MTTYKCSHQIRWNDENQQVVQENDKDYENKQMYERILHIADCDMNMELLHVSSKIIISDKSKKEELKGEYV